MSADIFNLEPLGWFLFVLTGIIIGLGKGGIAGAGTVAVPIMASIFPASYSVGILLPLLVCGDILGLLYYRKSIIIKEVLKALPLVIVGIVGGYLFLKFFTLSDTNLKRLIGSIVLFMLIFTEWQRRNNAGSLPRPNTVVMVFLALLGGSTSMVANAAGPVMILYLLYLGMTKEQFMGVRSSIFVVLNSVKVPFHVELGNITWESLYWDLHIIPAIIVGFFLGAKLLKIIPQDKFTIVIKVLTAGSCIKLLLS